MQKLKRDKYKHKQAEKQNLVLVLLKSQNIS